MIRKSTSIPRIHTDRDGLKHADLTEQLIGIFFHVYNGLGHGFLESVYEQAFCHSLAQANIFFERQIAIPVWFEGQRIGDFRADLLADRKVIVEFKTGTAIDVSWEKQLLNYLRSTEIEVGLLFNFGTSAEFRRYVFENNRKKIRNDQRSSAAAKF